MRLITYRIREVSSQIDYITTRAHIYAESARPALGPATPIPSRVLPQALFIHVSIPKSVLDNLDETQDVEDGVAQLCSVHHVRDQHHGFQPVGFCIHRSFWVRGSAR